MSRKTAIVLLVFAALACKRAAPPKPPAKAPVIVGHTMEKPTDVGVDIDSDNLLNLAYGASVVSRTGEANLETSAVQAIDSLSNTYWSSPPVGARQTIVFALPTRTRVERLGVTGYKEVPTGKIRFDASLDAVHWREVAVQSPQQVAAPQIADIKPIEARYIRIETIEPASGYVYFRSVHALGTELERAPLRTFDGCWTINGQAARFAQDGARVRGTIAGEPPTHIDGGTDGRVAMLTWTRGPNHGYAVMTYDPGTRALSGLTMYDEISTQNAATAWFGKPCDSASPYSPSPRSRGEGRGEGRWSMYGLVFDANETLIESLSASTLDELATILRAPGRFRIVSHELRMDAPERRTAARLASLRAALQKRGVDVAHVELVSAGSKWTDPVIVAAIQRLLGSRIDLERVGR